MAPPPFSVWAGQDQGEVSRSKINATAEVREHVGATSTGTSSTSSTSIISTNSSTWVQLLSIERCTLLDASSSTCTANVPGTLRFLRDEQQGFTLGIDSREPYVMPYLGVGRAVRVEGNELTIARDRERGSKLLGGAASRRVRVLHGRSHHVDHWRSTSSSVSTSNSSSIGTYR